MIEKQELPRQIGGVGAVMLGLGSILGTGVFVSIGIAAGVAGPNIIWAIVIAAVVAICNGLSSAQLAAVHPVSGGTYEYGYRWLSPRMGFVAGWLFLCAKSASAATAALGLSGYLASLMGQTASENQWMSDAGNVVGGLIILTCITFIVLMGIRLTTRINTVIVSLTLVSLTVLVVAGFWVKGDLNLPKPSVSVEVFTLGQPNDSWYSMLSAAALMFVAYTGYGRIATMGEEVVDPRKIIPRAMIATLAIAMLAYVCVAWVGIATIGPAGLSEATGKWAAPLLKVAESTRMWWVVVLVGVGGVTAMLGVLLNLILGLSRVVLAMSRRSDLPNTLAAIDRRGVPLRATLAVAAVIGTLVLVGDVKLAWSFSATTVLIYYALTNLCAIRVDSAERIFPVAFAWCGLLGCCGLVLFIPWQMLAAVAGLIAVGLLIRSFREPNASDQ